MFVFQAVSTLITASSSSFRFRAGPNFVVLTSLTLVMALVGGAPIRAQERGSTVPSVQIVATLLTDHKAFSRPTTDATKTDVGGGPPTFHR